MQRVRPFERSHNHLAQHRLLLLQLSQLLLEVVILLLLVYHAQLQRTVERLHQGVGRLEDLLVNVFDFGFHTV